ncbi:MAG: hypothetical protein BMS9Abin13_198 [Patescibacteria group bacterium]|nr:MAG: hypothetical protein BMS9Abin13_198 [Patescibacteria group bacterium]
MKHKKVKVFFVLLAVLGTLYAVNIFNTKNISGLLVDAPIKLLFTTIKPSVGLCENCFDTERIISLIDTSHNIEYRKREVTYGGVLSRRYIERYDIKNIPAIIVSGDITNENILGAWNSFLAEKRGDRIVIDDLLPYYDIQSGEVKGVVSAILLKDETCEDCFDEDKYVRILEQFGMFIGDIASYDITSPEGENLVQKYAIAKIPALILSPDASDYPEFLSSWEEVGTREDDGWLVFREVQKLGAEYTDI